MFICKYFMSIHVILRGKSNILSKIAVAAFWTQRRIALGVGTVGNMGATKAKSSRLLIKAWMSVASGNKYSLSPHVVRGIGFRTLIIEALIEDFNLLLLLEGTNCLK